MRRKCCCAKRAVLVATGLLMVLARDAIGQVVINEIMPDPANVFDDDGEWFELYNADQAQYDLNGWKIEDNEANSFAISGSLIVAPGEYLVFARRGDPGVNGGVSADYDYPNIFSLLNTIDALVLRKPDGSGGFQEVDRVEYTSSWPFASGHSMELSNPWASNRNGPALWATASSQWGAGSDYGTPGSANLNMVPEPATAALFGAGAACLLGIRRTRQRRRSKGEGP